MILMNLGPASISAAVKLRKLVIETAHALPGMRLQPPRSHHNTVDEHGEGEANNLRTEHPVYRFHPASTHRGKRQLR